MGSLVRAQEGEQVEKCHRKRWHFAFYDFLSQIVLGIKLNADSLTGWMLISDFIQPLFFSGVKNDSIE
jgi:hypothetical protein